MYSSFALQAAIALHLFALREDARSPGCWAGKRVLELGSGTGYYPRAERTRVCARTNA